MIVRCYGEELLFCFFFLFLVSFSVIYLYFFMWEGRHSIRHSYCFPGRCTMVYSGIPRVQAYCGVPWCKAYLEAYHMVSHRTVAGLLYCCMQERHSIERRQARLHMDVVLVRSNIDEKWVFKKMTSIYDWGLHCHLEFWRMEMPIMPNFPTPQLPF